MRRKNSPARTYRHVRYRPLPDSSVRKFGQWITGEEWTQITSDISPSNQVEIFEALLKGKIDEYCPERTLRLGSQDKPFINSELKRIHRCRQREYTKKGQTEKYKKLKKEFEVKYKEAAEKYLM